MSDYKEFKTTEEVECWANCNYKSFLENIHSIEYQKVYEYTGSWYRVLNEFLRESPDIGSIEFNCLPSSEEKEDVIILSNLIKRYALAESIFAYRFVPKSYFNECCGIRNKLCVGMSFSDKAFISTTLLPSVLSILKKERGYGYILKIKIPKGTKGLYVSQDNYQNNKLREYEFLLPANTPFKITKISGIINKTIECEVQQTVLHTNEWK